MVKTDQSNRSKASFTKLTSAFGKQYRQYSPVRPYQHSFSIGRNNIPRFPVIQEGTEGVGNIKQMNRIANTKTIVDTKNNPVGVLHSPFLEERSDETTACQKLRCAIVNMVNLIIEDNGSAE